VPLRLTLGVEQPENTAANNDKIRLNFSMALRIPYLAKPLKFILDPLHKL